MRGRAPELATLSAALQDASIGIVLISGPGGAGKSALARAALETASPDAFVTGVGQFPPDNVNGAAPLVSAVGRAVDDALEGLFDPEAALDTLAARLGDTARAFAAAPGSLGQLAARTGPAASVVGIAAAAERLSQALGIVLAWLASIRPQTLLLLDDWGRGGPQTAALLSRLMADAPHLRLLATARSEEPLNAWPGQRWLRVSLSELPSGAPEEIIADLLDGDRETAADVADLLASGARLPFDLVDAVAALRAGEALVERHGRWRLDRARAAELMGGSVAERLARRLSQASSGVRRLAEVLAIYGETATAGDLAACLGVPRRDVDADLQALARLGLVRSVPDGVRFAHDHILVAVRAGISEASSALIAGQLAETLRRSGVRPAPLGRGATMLNARLRGGLADADPPTWSPLFAAGAGLARSGGANARFGEWAAAALELARAAGQPGPLVLREAIFAAVERSDFAEGRRLADELLALGVDPIARAEADELRALVRRAEGDIEGALTVAREALGRIGVRLPSRVSRWRLLAIALRVMSSDVPRAARQAALAPGELEVFAPSMRALNAAGSLLFEQDPMRAMLLAIGGIPNKLVAGSASGAATYSVLCTAFGAFRQGERWATLSDELQDPRQPLRATALHYATNFGFAMRRSRHSAGPRIDAMERMAYAEGDLPVAAYANRRRAIDTVFGDAPLADMATRLDNCLMVADRLGDRPTGVTIAALREFVERLGRAGSTPWRLDGRYFDSAAFTRSPLAGATHVSRHIHMLEALLAATFGAWESGAAVYERSQACFRFPALQQLPQTWFFATALSLLRTGRRPSRWRMAVLRHHARHNPADHAHRVRILDAEELRRRGKTAAALVAYAQALALAERSGCAIELGLVANTAAEGARRLGDTAAARRFIAQRDLVWTRLGAHAMLGALGAAPRPAAADLASSAARTDDVAAKELELRALREMAERGSRAKSRLLAEVAHELRTPLQGAVELLEAPREAGEDPATTTLRATLRHLSTVVDDLADMGALEAGGINLARSPFDLRRTLELTAAMHAAANADRRLKLQLAACPTLVGDEVRVRQVISNLLSNALKHGEGVVSLTLTVEPVEDAVNVRIRVADDGPGVAPEDMARIFEPFQRSGEAQTDGLGLGLPIARRIALAMGGELTARSGSTGSYFEFGVRLPSSADEPFTRSTPGLSVLLVEDVALSRRVLAGLLSREACEVIEARDGLEALARWATCRVDCVITDERMPHLRGSELARRLRERGFDGPIAIVAGADDSELRLGVSGIPGVTVLRKPLDHAQLRYWLRPDVGTLSASVRTDRVREIVEALGEAAFEIFRGLPQELETLTTSVLEALDAGDCMAIGEASHRLAGLAEHFGLSQVSQTAQALEADARGPALGCAEREAYACGLRDAVAAIDWARYVRYT